MKLLLINSVIGFGSTGRIVLDIARKYENDGFQVKIAYGRTSKVSSKTSNKKVHFPTKNLVKYIDVESYKKYNSINTDINSSIDDNEEYFIEQKADVKCTCLLF